MSYIQEKMAAVGAGIRDTLDAQTICDKMDTDQRDVLDCMDSFGVNQRMRPEYQHVVDGLKANFSDDDLIVLGRYVAARRNLEEY